MANYVKISSVCAPLCPVSPEVDLQEAVDKVISYWREKLRQVLPDRPDLIVLPECCDRPDVTMYPAERRQEFYRHRKNQIRDFFAGVAKEYRCYIAYSAIREMEDGSFRNSTQLIDRTGSVVGAYNKNHLITPEYDKNGVLYGKDAPIFETDFGRVACAICFDLNFDELRLQYVKAKPDLILFSSAYHGGLMQSYWAYSCRAHFVASVYPKSPSAILSPVGNVIATSTNYHHFVTTTVNLDCKVIHLDLNRVKFNAIKEKYGSKVNIYDPGQLGSVLISSESEDFSIDDVIQEFELELLDDYMSRSLAHRCAPGHIEC
ncbi:MAG: carbon-nitrogen hydrolase family protein [Paenibacillus sp.]|nr:carbon-nitrogen hydrolase family protein [Paenibacillus sp.]